VFDLSNENNGFGTARARGHTLILKPLLKRELNLWTVELEPAVSLQYFGQPLDDSRELAPKLKLTRTYGYKSSVELSVNAGRRFYETTRLLTADGTPISGTHEQLTTRGAEVQWRHWWGAGHHWRTTLRAQASRSDDNGSGYFDHDKWAAYAQLALRAGTLDRRTHYARGPVPSTPCSPMAPPPVRTAQRDEVTAELKVEYQWTKHLKSVASAERQRSAANTSFDDFSVTTVQGWLEWEFLNRMSSPASQNRTGALVIAGVVVPLLVLAAAIGFTQYQLRDILRAQIARRDATLLDGLLRQQLRESGDETAADPLSAVLETTRLPQLPGVRSVIVYSPSGSFVHAWPLTAASVALDPHSAPKRNTIEAARGFIPSGCCPMNFSPPGNQTPAPSRCWRYSSPCRTP
jgi:hypothetical protein